MSKKKTPLGIIDFEKPEAVSVEEIIERYSLDNIVEETKDWYLVKGRAEEIYAERIERRGAGNEKSDWFLAIRLEALYRYQQERRQQESINPQN
ncbi:MAG: hypothetical protein FJ044_00465 [Candidatus Cloacimonetes bacterium]|nr:hypothetical protein [Candidatus Cloacimonadota bacterium]